MEKGNGARTMHKILIVEDEPDIAELIAFNLDRAGYTTVIATMASPVWTRHWWRNRT